MYRTLLLPLFLSYQVARGENLVELPVTFNISEDASPLSMNISVTSFGSDSDTASPDPTAASFILTTLPIGTSGEQEITLPAGSSGFARLLTP